jgi:2-dehydropantoate 2-reductase
MPETTKIQSVAILGRGALGVMYSDFLTPRMPEGSVYFLADNKRCERYKTRPSLLPLF